YFVTGSRPAETALCARPEMYEAADRGQAAPPTGIAGEATPDLPVDDERWKVPPSLDVMLQSLATLRRPSGALYRLYTDAAAVREDTPTGYRYGPNRIGVGGTPIDVGFSIDLTIEPTVQELPQQTAASYSSLQEVWLALGISRAEESVMALG